MCCLNSLPPAITSYCLSCCPSMAVGCQLYCQLNSSFVSAIGHIGFYHKGIKSSDELAPAAFFESPLFRFDEIFFQDLCLFGFWLKTEENFGVIALLIQIKAYVLWDQRIISRNNPNCVFLKCCFWRQIDFVKIWHTKCIDLWKRVLIEEILDRSTLEL